MPEVKFTEETGPEFPEDNSTPNGTAPEDSEPDWSDLFNAPDYTTFIKPSQSRVATAYRKRANSLLKAGFITSLNAGQYHDAAAFLEHGPAFAAATGQLADHDAKVRGIIDMLTTPTNPYGMFVLTTIPLIAQLFRNHEQEVRQVPATWRERRAMRKATRLAEDTQPPRFTLKILGRTIPVRFRVRVKIVGALFKGFRTQTVDPDQLTRKVFSDPDLLKAMERAGIRPGGGNDGT
jgi:hypothetical protein